MAKSKYAEYIRKVTGWNAAEYKREYNRFYKRARNYEAITGRSVDIARQFYYSFKYADDPSGVLMGIEAAPATQPRRAGESITFSPTTSQAVQRVLDITAADVLDHFRAFINKCAEAVSYGWHIDPPVKVDVPIPDFANVVYTAQALEAGYVDAAEAESVFRQEAMLYHDWKAAVKDVDGMGLLVGSP